MIANALNKSKSVCCQSPIKISEIHDLEKGTYSVILHCAQCGRSQTLEQARKKVTFRELRESRGMTVEEVVKSTGLHTQTIIKAEDDCRLMHCDAVMKLCNLYCIPIALVKFCEKE